MTQFFSFNRFKLLVLMHWVHNRKRYGLSVLAFLGLLIIRFLLFMVINDENDKSESIQKTTYFFSLFVVGTFYASQYFSDLGSRAKAGNFLLVPASTFEKVLCALLYTVVLFIVVLTAAYYLVDLLMLTISNEVVRTGEQVDQDTITNVFKADLFLFREDLRINALLFFLSIQSAFLLGSVYFNNYSFIKTIISGFVVYCLVFGIIYILYNPFFTGDGTQVRMPRTIEQLIGILVMYVIAPASWLLTYYRLKQKQV